MALNRDTFASLFIPTDQESTRSAFYTIQSWLPRLHNLNTLRPTRGSWVPVDQSGAGLTFSTIVCEYVKIGDAVIVCGRFTFPTTASGANALIGGLPFIADRACPGSLALAIDVIGSLYITPDTDTITPYTAGAQLTNVALSTVTLRFSGQYFTVPNG